jgi:hypothetical protein
MWYVGTRFGEKSITSRMRVEKFHMLKSIVLHLGYFKVYVSDVKEDSYEVCTHYESD